MEPSPTPTAAPTKAYVVTFDAGVSSADQVTAVSSAGATTTDTIGVLRIHAVSASDAAVDALRADERVDAVELDRSRAVESTPDDAAYPDQWALPIIGWDQVYGTVDPSGSAIVAVLDTGVDASHPDLDDNIVSGASFVAGSSWSSDANGHGTAMAGIVAAETGNGTGVAGVGFDGVNVMPITVLGADGLGRDSDIVEGLVWAADHGADVALMAFSANGYSSALQAAIDYAWSKGMVLVAAAGNDGSSTPAFPAGDAGVVGVSATNSDDAVAGFSNTGEAVFLGAPGAGIVTLSGTISGTSAAAAHVAGAAALLAADDSSASNGVIIGRLARNADAIGTTGTTGNGRLNLARAMSDTGTGAARPAGVQAADGGPYVGPYAAAGNGTVTGVIRNSV
ncbi:MAG TPA: S8 family serine peptidase, partial [Candidatus Saccharimonadales bacterium]|nr:S8 family serine peptidase [Candidatus Saccharimonadales bacterium]